MNPQLTFHLAKQKHLAWKFRFIDFINGNSTMKLNHIISHCHCDCGKWLISEGITELYGYMPEVQRLDTEHKKLHELAKSVVESKEKGENEVMMEHFRQLANSSNTMLALIEQINNNLQKDSN